MASPQAEQFHVTLRQLADEMANAGNLSLDEQRQKSEAFAEVTGEPSGVTWSEVDAGGIRSVWADPEGGSKDRVLQYVHGGGYIMGSADGYRNLTGHLAKA